MNTLSRVMGGMMAGVLGLSIAAFAQTGEPSAQPTGDTQQQGYPNADPNKTMTVSTVAVSAAAGKIITADDLLNALERAGSDLRTLQANVHWTKEFGAITGGDGKHVRIGRLMFDSPTHGDVGAKPRRRFQVEFTREIVDDRQDDKRTIYVFDGQWFVERLPDQKEVRRRQVVPPGETIDPLAIGEGPFPVPIGQQRAKILERFSAELLPPGDGFDTPHESLSDTYQLRLTPRAGADEAKQLKSIRIWYRKQDLLPRLARTQDRDGSTTEVFLTAMELNKPLPEGAFDTSRPAGWKGDDQNYRRANADQ